MYHPDKYYRDAEAVRRAKDRDPRYERYSPPVRFVRAFLAGGVLSFGVLALGSVGGLVGIFLAIAVWCVFDGPSMFTETHRKVREDWEVAGG